MTAKEFVKSRMPKARAERHVKGMTKGKELKDVYWLIRNGYDTMYFASGKTESDAWRNAKTKLDSAESVDKSINEDLSHDPFEIGKSYFVVTPTKNILFTIDDIDDANRKIYIIVDKKPQILDLDLATKKYDMGTIIKQKNLSEATTTPKIPEAPLTINDVKLAYASLKTSLKSLSAANQQAIDSVISIYRATHILERSDKFKDIVSAINKISDNLANGDLGSIEDRLKIQIQLLKSMVPAIDGVEGQTVSEAKKKQKKSGMPTMMLPSGNLMSLRNF